MWLNGLIFEATRKEVAGGKLKMGIFHNCSF
jgi:hypothetical protein